MENPSGQVLVIFGASGDLAKRKLLPALFALHCEGFLPKNFAIVGVGRTEMNSDQYRQSRADDIKKFARTTAADFSKLDAFLSLVEYANFNTDNPNEYSKLADFIEKVRQLKNIPDNITFYFGIPPEMYSPTADGIKTSGLNLSNCGGFRRVVVEKPFGKSLDSARAVNLKLGSVFSENEIYRIDHYLGKETVQNILVLRFANEIFESLWNRNHIDSVEISVSESLGVENRGAYYDKSGAMRDMVQNHLLNLAAFVAMECPASFDAESIRDEVAKVLQCLRPMDEKTIDSNTMRAQYSESGNLPAYRSEKNVAADSTTETFAAMKFFIENWRWGGVPFYLSDACRSSAACDFSERQRIDELRFYVLRFRFRRGGCCCFDAEKPPHYSSCDDGLDRRLGHVYCFCGSSCSGDCDFTVALCSGSRRLTDLCACGGK